MALFEVISILVTLAALFGFINYHVLKLPATVGLMILSLCLAVPLFIASRFHPGVQRFAASFLGAIDFDATVLHGMLGFLLFAGAIHVNLNDLYCHRRVVAVLAVIATLLSTVLVAAFTWMVCQVVGVHLTWIQCLLFGALISPTDPIAVVAIMKRLHTPKAFEVQIAGESMFNDGVGVVIFLAVLGMAQSELGIGESVSMKGIAESFARDAIGGIIFGLLLGGVAFLLLRTVDDYQVEIPISLAVVTGGYVLAEKLHVSAPLAMVAAGLLIGNQGRKFAMSAKTCDHLDNFWELVDDILNAILFVLIGVEVLTLALQARYFVAAALMIPMILFARLLSVGIPIYLIRRISDILPHAVKLLTVGGMRGAISIALALSLKDSLTSESKVAEASIDSVIVMTYVVVVFSIIAQGLFIGPLMKRLVIAQPERSLHDAIMPSNGELPSESTT